MLLDKKSIAINGGKPAPAVPKDYFGADQLRGFYRENLVCRREALEVLRLELPYAPGETETSIKRIAHGLSSSAGVFGFEEVARAALLAETTSNGLMQVYLDDLIRAIDKSIDTEDTNKAKILLIEPDADHASLLELSLGESDREILVAATAAQAEDILQRESVALIILELDLPDTDGRNLLMRLRARSRTAATPVLVLSAWSSPQIQTECLALGANAFYEEPYDPATLSSSVSVWLQRSISVDSKDALTGLPDRVALAEIYERLRSFYNFARDPLCVAVLDFDHFATLNDIYGFTTGDQVLRRAAELIRKMLRPSDFLARWEGQRFVLLLSSTSLQAASEVLDGALQAVRHETFQGADEQAFRASFSAGVSEITSNRSTLERAVSETETILKEAKQSGRGRVFTPHTERTPVKEKVLLVEDDEVISKLLMYRLEREGIDVVHYDNGARAFAEAHEHEPDLVLLDVRLPGMDGFELLSRLRRIPSYAKVPIMMLTAMGSEYDMVRGFEIGADDYVLKPFSPLELVARLRRLLKRTA
jgi:two-component system, cell cycle response regulator